MTHPSPFRSKALAAATILLAALMLAACSKPADEKPGIDYEHIQRICLSQPDSALQLLDRAEQAGTVTPLDANALRSIIYNNALFDYPRAVEYALRALDDPTLPRYPEKEARLVSMAAAEYCSMGDFNRTLEMCSRAMDFAEKNDNQQLAAEVLLTLGTSYREVSDDTRAIRSLSRSVDLFVAHARKQPTWSNWSNVVTAMAQYSEALLDSRRYDELFSMESNYRAAIVRTASYSQDMAASDDYSWAAYYSVYAIAYAQTAQTEKARHMFGELSKCLVVKRGEGAVYLTPYYVATSQWADALASATQEEAEWKAGGRDTIDSYYARTLLANKARAQAALGQYHAATHTQQRVIALADSVDHRDKGLHAMWMSEQLGNTALIMHVDRQDRHLKYTHIAIAVVSTLAAALLALVIVIVRYNRTIRRKNRAATRLISELGAYKDRYYAELAAYQPSDESTPTADEAAYNELLRQMRDRQLYTQPALTRKDVAEALGITGARLDHLLALHPGDDFTTLVNDMRLDHAARQLARHPEYTIESVAHDCGLPVRQTFYRQFVRKYGITPSEYRANALQNDDRH